MTIENNIRLTLRAAPGRKPVFHQANIFISSGTAPGGNYNVTIADLILDHAMVHVTRNGTGTGTVELRNLVIDAPTHMHGGISLQSDGGTLNATIYNNTVVSNAPNNGYGVISLKSYGGTLKATASFNRIRSSNSGLAPGAGIMVDIANGSASSVVTLHANEIRGAFGRAGIFLSENGAGGPNVIYTANLFDNVVVGSQVLNSVGIEAVASNGELTTNFYNNTITLANPALRFSRWNPANTGKFTGMLANNLIRARGASGVAIAGPNAFTGSVVGNSSNLINGSTNNFTPNANTIMVNAQLVNEAHPRLRSDSPAIDQGTSTIMARNSHDIPLLDADGLRRHKRGITGAATTKVDIGAYEFGDILFEHIASPDTISGGNLTWFSHPSLYDNLTANLNVTPKMVDGVTVSKQFIPWWDEEHRWALFAENSADSVPTNAHFHVFSAAAGSGSFRHTTSSSPSSAPMLNDSSVNNKPDAFVLVSRTSSLSTHVSNPGPFGIYPSFSSGEWHWYIGNFDGSSFPGNTGFSVYAQDRSPNAFLVTVNNGNRNDDGNLVLDHPLLNGTPCALPLLTAVENTGSGFTNRGAYNLSYDETAQRWVVFQFGFSGILPVGARFHVLVNPAQVWACAHTELFSDGFEG